MGSTRIQIMAQEGTDEAFSSRIRSWAAEVLERVELATRPRYVCITVLKTIEDLRAFYREEKEELGVVTVEEMEFLATHDAWRGYPRVHVCEERLRGVEEPVIRGAIHHEVGHAVHHGTPEFYTFRFSSELQEVGRLNGLDFARLQQCVYSLSLAIKDREVVQWLAGLGLGFGQHVLLRHLLSDTEDERRAWDLVCDCPGLKKVALAALLKVLLPIEALISMGGEDAHSLKEDWSKAYGWIPQDEQIRLALVADRLLSCREGGFQERLETAVLRFLER